MSIIFLDIETLPSPTKPNRDELKVPGNISKPETIEKWKDENIEKVYRDQALNSMQGQIICIGLLSDDIPEWATISIETPDKEKYLLEQFINTIRTNDEIVGHNILGFDAPFIFHRCLKYSIKPPLQFRTLKHEMLHDTMLMFDPFRWKQYYSLKDIAAFFDIPKNNDITGGDVFDLYQKGAFDKIRKHCLDDIRVMKQVYERLNF